MYFSVTFVMIFNFVVFLLLDSGHALVRLSLLLDSDLFCLNDRSPSVICEFPKLYPNR